MTGDQLDADHAVAEARAFPGLAGMDLAQVVSAQQAYAWSEGEWKLGAGFTQPDSFRFNVVAYDFGVKRTSLRMLASRGCKLTVVPARTSAAEVLALNPMASSCPTAPATRNPATMP